MTGAATPSCPRCGYDLSGQVATWERQCPLLGTCSECGLGVAWSEVMRPDRVRVRGFIEHERGWRTIPAALRTLWWALLPWRFWKRVRMEHPPRHGRIVMWVLAIWLVCHLALAGLRVATVECKMSSLIAVSRAAPGVVPDRFDWYLNCFLTPMLWYERWGMPTDRTRIGPFLVLVGEWPAFAWGCLAAWVMFPVMVLALPVTRRRAKVRGVHIWRAFAYSGTAMLLFIVPSLVRGVDTVWSVCIEGTFASRLPRLGPWGSLIVVGVMVGWLGIWWGHAWGRGMRMPRATLHVGVLSGVVAFAAFCALGLAEPELLLDIGLFVD